MILKILIYGIIGSNQHTLLINQVLQIYAKISTVIGITQMMIHRLSNYQLNLKGWLGRHLDLISIASKMINVFGSKITHMNKIIYIMDLYVQNKIIKISITIICTDKQNVI